MKDTIKTINGALAILFATVGLSLGAYSQTEAKKKGEKLMAENTYSQVSKPNADLKSLDRLVGTWKVTGEAEGEIKYEWAEGGFFLLQHFNLLHGGRKIKGIEVIGHLQGLGETPSKDIQTRVYSYLDGLTLDYVYELEGDTLTIWGGKKGSPAYYKAKFSADGNTLTGGWVWPGGGYTTTTTRVK